MISSNACFTETNDFFGRRIKWNDRSSVSGGKKEEEEAAEKYKKERSIQEIQETFEKGVHRLVVLLAFVFDD